MEPFLRKVLHQIIKNHPNDLDQVCIVLPGKRPAVYLRKYFGELLEGTNWLPDMLAINQFVETVTTQSVSDKNELLFHFFKLYQKQEFYKKEETFDEFLMWAPQVIADYNDVDNYLKDGKYIFQDLTNIKEMDEWGRANLDDEGYSWSFNNDPLSVQQQDYLSFWSKIGLLYHELRLYCITNERFYSGLLNRLLAENLVDKDNLVTQNDVLVSSENRALIKSNLNEWSKIYFVGLNALSSAEEKFVFSLVESEKAETFWDSDSLYMDDNIHEAGLFLRRYKKRLPDFNWQENHFKNSKLRINIYESGSDSAQVKFAGELLKEEPALNKAIVLANENFLIPLLSSLPDLEDNVNITLGYPLVNTPFYGWVRKTIYILKKRSQEVYHLDFMEWISHPFVSATLSKKDFEKIKAFGQQLVRDNSMFVSLRQLKEIGKTSDVLNSFLSVFINKKNDFRSVIVYFDSCLLLIRSALDKQKMHIESLFEFSKIFNRLEGYSNNFSFVKTLETFDKLFTKLAGAASLSFLGEPLKGSQIMGMLESRTLDFDHLIILGANEGYLPSPKNRSSFIPYELKRFYGLPTHKENESIFAYNFYRMMHKASRVDICYSTMGDTFGKAEASRYVFQIRNEFPDKITEVNSNVVMTQQSENENKELAVEVTKEVSLQVIEKLKSGISPSAFNTFLRCPLDFYYRYVVGFNEVDEVEENIQSNTFGTIVHQVLEIFYTEIIGEDLTLTHIKQWESKIDSTSISVFESYYKSRNFTEGTNYIALEVARRYLRDFFVEEKLMIEKANLEDKKITILALEEKLSFELDLSEYGYAYPIKIHGYADRIDKIAGKIRIVDYKTGGTESGDLMVKHDFSNLLEGKKPKALQVLLYSYLYHKKNDIAFENIESGIISFKNIKNGFMKFGVKKPTKKQQKAGEQIPDNIVIEFEEKLALLALEMIREGQEWKHDVESDFCGYC